MQFQNETWQDLSGYDFKLSLEGDVYPKDGPPTAFKIYPSNSRTLDNPWGKPIYTGKNVRSWQSQWPGTTKKHWNFPTVAREYWEKMLGPIEWDNITFKILHRIATDEYNKGLKRESYQSFLSRQAVEKQDQQKEQKINEDLQVIEHFVKISGIEEDLKKMQLIPIGGYKVHQAQQTMSLAENSSVRKSPDTKIIILSAMVAASGDASSTDSSMKWMNWMVALDGNNNLIERRQLPGFLKSDDLMVRSDGGLRIRGTEFPPLQRPRLSCIKAHPFK
jgi:hypothetical protein